MTKIAVLADSHLPEMLDSISYDTVSWAFSELKALKPDFILVMGDVCMRNEAAPFRLFYEKLEALGTPFMLLSGNHDVGDPQTRDEILALCSPRTVTFGNRTLIGLNYTKGHLDEASKALLDRAPDNAVVAMHYTVTAMDEDSRNYLFRWAGSRAALILQAHSHHIQDYYISHTRVFGVSTLDPKKPVCAAPGYDILELDDDSSSLTRVFMPFPLTKAERADFRAHIGISCFDPERDIDYAIEHKIRHIELHQYRCNETYTRFLAKKIDQWRQSGGQTCSLHMPDLKWSEDTRAIDTQAWTDALNLVREIGFDALTIHTPKASTAQMAPDSPVRRAFLQQMIDCARNVPESTAISIENQHCSPGEPADERRGFGYLPEEMIGWIDEINGVLGSDRVGFLFDIGHARNNPPFKQYYALDVWFAMLGSRVNAYHLHQVCTNGKALTNHHPITDWYGYSINYFAFFLAWKKGQLRHRPMFLEVRNLENCIKSLDSLDRLFAQIQD